MKVLHKIQKIGARNESRKNRIVLQHFNAFQMIIFVRVFQDTHQFPIQLNPSGSDLENTVDEEIISIVIHQFFPLSVGLCERNFFIRSFCNYFNNNIKNII